MVKVSIVIPVLNNLALTKQCIESVVKHTTPGDYELIVVDNGSDKETQDYLEALQVKVIRNNENLGFSKAINQGFQAARGDHLFMLNNDTILFPEWLPRMLKRFEGKVGAVGPVSNYVMGPQQVSIGRRSAKPEHIHNLVSIQQKDETIEDAKLLIGFAMMISREAYEKVGTLDERFFAGCDDLDYSIRLRQAGYTLNIARDVFVFHFGNKTSKGILNKATEFYEESNKLFFEKWSKLLSTEITSHRQAFEVAFGAESIPLTIVTIVKEECGLLRNMIKVTNAFCKDYCIVDTGSNEEDISALRTFLLNNGSVHQFEWVNDYSKARNYGLQHCRGKWILQLDADEVIDKRYTRQMRQLLEQDECDALRFTIINFRESPFLVENPKTDQLTSIRMWRNNPKVKYQGIIHETVTETVTAAKYRIAESPVPIYHFAYLKPGDRHLDLMKHAAAVEPKRSNNHYFLGELYLQKGELKRAAASFTNAIATASTKKAGSEYTKKVKQMLEITEATIKKEEIGKFPESVRNHFRYLIGHARQ